MKLSEKESLRAWLELTVVAAVHPEDMAARESLQVLQSNLRDQHDVESVTWEETPMGYRVKARRQGGSPPMVVYDFSEDEAYRLFHQLESDSRYR
ncbi:hypothetical protein [Pasteuria penetrans]|uniref:hypothetical protein n=1 Tax=Pasteuria penetrans TaxID=86005 RepID=UPI000FAA9701|nr:hypothetical protein [Pasteuria penetrans]